MASMIVKGRQPHVKLGTKPEAMLRDVPQGKEVVDLMDASFCLKG
jgi:hypothetical protein